MTETTCRSQQPETMTADPGGNLKHPAVLISLFVPTLIGIYLFLTSTSYLIPGIWPYDAKRILQFVLLLILFLVPALHGRIRGELGALASSVPGWLRITLFGVFGWGVCSSLINAQSVMHLLNSLMEVALLTALVLGIFVVAACRRIAGRWFDRIAITLITLTGLAIGMQDLVGVAAAHFEGVEFNFYTTLIYFSFPRFYNQVQSWIIPALVVIPLLFTRHRLAYFICFVVLGLQWYIILATGARGSFVSITAAIVFTVIFLPAVRYRLLKWQAFGFTLGAIIYVLVMFSFEAAGPSGATGPGPEPVQQSDFRDSDMGNSGGRLSGGDSSFFKQSMGRPMAHSSGRTWMWSVMVSDARSNPLLGIGPMNYVCVKPYNFGHPHNFPLQLAAEWGIPVALAACVVFLVLLWHGCQGIRRGVFGKSEDGMIAGLLLTAVLAAALHSCLSGVMVMPASQVTGLLICGMLLGLYPSAPRERPVTPTLRWSFVPGLLLTAGLLGLGGYELKTMDERESRMPAKDTGIPRIWQQAKVCRLYTQ